MGKRRSKEADVVLPPLGKTELSELCFDEDAGQNTNTAVCRRSL
ncbi:hypothetical protein [Ructibacterium gallinarum]|nr:hypothetical protein [Ructibacterium gallinarum]